MDCLPLPLIERLAPLAQHMGVVTDTSFLRAYRKAGGDASKLSTSLRREVNKRTKVAPTYSDALWADGAPLGLPKMPSKQHLASIMWGQSREAAALKSWAEDLDFEPVSPTLLSALATLAKVNAPDALLPLQEAAVKLLKDFDASSITPPPPIRFNPTPARAFWGPSVQKMLRQKAETDTDEHFILGVQLEPTDGSDGHPVKPDADGDIYSADEVRKAAHWWAEFGRWNSIMHGPEFGGEYIAPADNRVVVLESWVTPVDIPIGIYGERQVSMVKAGTWLQAFRLNDEDVWDQVKTGHYDGLSIGADLVEHLLQEDGDAS